MNKKIANAFKLGFEEALKEVEKDAQVGSGFDKGLRGIGRLFTNKAPSPFSLTGTGLNIASPLIKQVAQKADPIPNDAKLIGHAAGWIGKRLNNRAKRINRIAKNNQRIYGAGGLAGGTGLAGYGLGRLQSDS